MTSAESSTRTPQSYGSQSRRRGRRATAMISQMSDDTFIGLLAGSHFLPFRVKWCCSTTDGAGILAFAFARTLATLQTYASNRFKADVSDMVMFVNARSLRWLHGIPTLLASSQRMQPTCSSSCAHVSFLKK